jgi:hypothetical protein
MTLGKPLDEAYHEIQVAIGRINNDTIRLRRLRDHLTKHHTRLVALFGGQFSGPNTSVCEAGFAIVRFRRGGRKSHAAFRRMILFRKPFEKEVSEPQQWRCLVSSKSVFRI